MTAVLFDMDGVLVDVSRSYLTAIQKTVEFFINNPVALTDIQEYRNRGGMNNDWDLTEAVLRERGKSVPKEKIIDVFQDIYLGKGFDGLIKEEQWLAHRNVLDRVSASYSMGIVTGRPKMEASYVLERFDVKAFFSVLVTMDDIPAGKNKPDPFGIIMAMRRLSTGSAYYLGDTVDDMAAAVEAGATPIGVISSGNDPELQKEMLVRHGAGRVLENVNEIIEVIR